MVSFSALTKYRIAFLVMLAKMQQGVSGVLHVKDVCEEAKIPPKFMLARMSEMVGRGLISATRGFGGGVRLTKPIHQISLTDILAFDNPKFSHGPVSEDTIKSLAIGEQVEARMYNRLIEEFGNVSLADLVEQSASA